jgi:D-hydroxyproline dehydrogenase subunit beta
VSSERPIVIIGAGLAGAACAHELIQTHATSLVLVEQQSQHGQHGSAQNAALIRSHASNPHTAALARQGARWWAQQDLADFDPCGSVLVGGRSAELVAGFRAQDHRWLKSAEVLDRTGHPLPEGQRAFFNPVDGIAAPQQLLDALLTRCVDAGIDMRLNCRANLDGETLFLDGKEQPYEALVIAAGAWSRELLELPIQAFARHLFVSESGQAESSPWVWDLDEELYWRRLDSETLLSACDERVVHRPDSNQWPAVVPDEAAILDAKLARSWPSLLPLKIRASWSGLRVLTPDDGFVLGLDPRYPRILWCTGLGGHGVTCSIPAARLAMQTLTKRTLSVEEHNLAQAHNLNRFATLSETWHS